MGYAAHNAALPAAVPEGAAAAVFAASTRPHIAVPPLALLGLEPMRAALEFLGSRLMDVDALPRGDGHPVVIFPGLGVDEAAVAPLQRCCQALGYVAYDWGRGFNSGPQGDFEDWLDELCDGVLEVSSMHEDRSVSLIGWSLGGIYAREIARKIPDCVRQVITLGTPFAAEGDVTNVGWLYRLLNGGPSRLQTDLAWRLRETPPVPVTSIYSRSDGIVAWGACREVEGRYAENVEVEASHIGLACHPRVWAVIADRLAQPEDEWRPYEERHTRMGLAPLDVVAQFVATASAHIGALAG